MRALIIAATLLALAHSARAYTFGLEAGSQVQATRASPTDTTIARVWATDEGSIVSHVDLALPVGGGRWVNHGHGGSPATLHGPAATWFLNSGVLTEQVCYIGQNNALFIGTSVNGAPLTWESIAAPAGATFVGHLAATTFFISGARQLIVVAPSTAGGLLRFVRPAAGGAGTWTTDTTLPWVGQFGVSVSKNPTETIVSFFTNHTSANRQIGMLRLNGATASVVNLGKPTGQTCVNTATIQGKFSDLTTTYRVSVACNTVNTSFHIATAPSETSTAFTWQSFTLPQATVAFSAIGGAVRPGNSAGTYVHEFFAIPSTNLSRFTIASAGTITNSDLGLTRDVDTVAGGLAVFPRGGSSRIFYIGKISDGHRMFERRGFFSNQPGDYRWLGSPSNLQFWPTPQTAAEAKVSSWRGTQAMSVVSRPGTGGLTDWPSVWFAFTTNQNEVIDASRSKMVTKQIDIAGVGPQQHNYTTDPTAVVTDDKVAFSFQLGLARVDCFEGQTQNCGCSGTTPVLRSTFYVVSTTTGLTHTAPVVIATATGTGTSPQIDHPWADIEHRPGFNNDIIHLAWWDLQGGTIKYAEFLQNGGLQPIRTLRTGSAGPPKVTASDSGRVVVYYGVPGGDVEMCELNAARDACTAAGWMNVGTYFYHHGVTVTPTSNVRSWYSISMALSETSIDTINYCFEVKESDLVHSDVRCGRLTRGGTGTWSVATAVIANAVPNDGKDQFLPEVSVTSEDDAFGAQDTVFGTWYDRAGDPLNRTYQVARTVSLDGGTTFSAPMLDANVSDPEFLPRHCHDPAIRFAGDYAAVEGDSLFKNPPVVVVAPGGSITTWMFSIVIGLGGWGA